MPRTRPFGLMPEDESTFGINPMDVDPDEMERLAMEQERISKEVMGDAYYSEGRPPGEPPGTRTIGAPGSDMYVKYTPPQEEEMPKLYKGQKAEGQPPGEQPDPETMRAKFAKKLIELIGFNPIGYDPYAEAKRKYLEEKERIDELNKTGPKRRKYQGYDVGYPMDITFDEVLKEEIAKKQAAMESLKFSFEQFDKDMGWKTIPQGGMAFQEGTGKAIVAPGKTKPPTEMELIMDSLEKKLGRTPTSAEILKEKEESAIRVTGAKAGVTEKERLGAQKGLIDDTTIKDWAKYVITAGELPPEAARLFRVPGAQVDAIKRITELLKEQGYDGAERAVQAASYKANRASLQFQEKQRGAAGSFVININGQLKRINKIMGDVIKRIGVRAVDLPIRELRTRFVGSGHERVLESYLMEVSREIGKLSTGSQASVAELSVEAQKKWDRIHDPNLSFKELKEILDATKEQANIRIKSLEEEIQNTFGRMGERRTGIGGAKKAPISPAEAIEELRRRGKIQ